MCSVLIGKRKTYVGDISTNGFCEKYVASEAFTPVVQLQYHEVDELFSMRSDLKNSDASNAILQLLNK